MKLLNIILLIVFFIFICISLTNNIEKFENEIDDEREKCTKESDNIKEPDNKENKESNNKETKEETKEPDDIIKLPLSKILEHPASETDKKLKKQLFRPININVNYNIEKNEVDIDNKYNSKCKNTCKCNKCKDKRCWPRSGDYVTGTVTNSVITTGHGAPTSLGSGPVRLEFTDEYTVPKKEMIMHPKYQQLGASFGSTDNAKISKDIFVKEGEDSYTLLKDKYISFPQERYSVTDLANMGIHK